jgi:signal transduction histidine kinase/CheY-like chemotaxis protein
VLNAIRRLNAPPSFESEELTQRARMFHNVMRSTMLIATILLVTLAAMNPSLVQRAMAAILTIDILGLVLLETNRRGHPLFSSAALVGGIVMLIAAMAWSAGGIRSPGMSLLFIFVLMAATLMGEKGGTVTAIASSIIGFAYVVLELTNVLPAPRVHYGPTALWVLYTIYLGVVLVLVRISSTTVRNALVRAEGELDVRRTAQANLASSLHELGERVKELRLLHSVSQLLRDAPVNAETLQRIVTMMPRAWQYPEVCEARIAFDGTDVRTAGWTDSPWRQSAPLRTAEGDGAIEVVYLEERPAADEGPFLAEERDLLVSLQDALVAWIERDGAERRRLGTEHQLRQSQKMQALGTLAGGIAHDFNNILTAIIGNAQLAAMELDPHHPARSSIDAVMDSSARASEIVKRILLFSRRQDVERKVMPLAPVVQEVVNLVRVSMPKNIGVETRVSPNLPNVLGDASQLYQAAMNLCTNAVHAMSPDGGTLSVTQDRVEVGPESGPVALELHPGTHVRLTVADTGVGMPPHVVERLFEPFFTTKAHGGTGLGLSVVHGIVRDHDGAIAVHSAPGKGSTFEIYLPAAVEQKQAVPAAASEMPRGSGQHVMYVDDEEALVAVMARLLPRIGYRCTGYSDPRAALQAFRASPQSFDAIVTDMAMPNMNGLQFADAVREARSDIPIAIASGNAGDVGQSRADIDMVIQKPISMDSLARLLDGLFDRAA